jgi:phosphatidate cytidylyltransferase
MFRTRLISGIVLVILALIFVISGGYALWAISLALSLVGVFELYRVFGLEKKLPGYLGYFLTVVYYGLLLMHTAFGFQVDWTIYLIIVLIVYLFMMVAVYPRYHSTQIAKAVFGIFYVAVMFSFLYRTRELDGGTYTVWLIVLSSWGCDTCAYCAGKLFGKHKMSPVLSPKKSVEGAVGGVAGTMLLTFIYGTVFAGAMQLDGSGLGILTLISGAGALLSMVGDLSASAIKRNYEIKDYGNLIPGHGGVLDRFDSMLFTAPVIYFLSFYFLK